MVYLVRETEISERPGNRQVEWAIVVETRFGQPSRC
jgi:hypothetical protein